VNRLRQFIKEAWSELKKVSWPNRTQVRNLTVLVFVVSFITGLYITAADTAYDYVVRFLAGLQA
jgi:preprotein translocase SecE subunit